MRRCLIFIVLTAVIAYCLSSCGGSDTVSPGLAALLELPDTSGNKWYHPGLPAPDSGCERLRIRPFGGSLGSVFRDVNEVHLASARNGGIEPIHNTDEAWANSRGLVEVRPCSLYYVDELKHSYPYLTREAADLLDEICARFRDSLDARGGGDYRPKVTSVLRTPASVGRLRRVNRNATGESAHIYATTFDISYSKFICDNPEGVRRTFEDLKNLLGETIAGLRDQGRCLVKHERRQACFHITVCAPDSVQIYR